MAITLGYATLQDLKTYLAISGSTDDARLETAIESASRAIDAWTRRQFHATTATRYYSADVGVGGTECNFDDDLLTVTEVATDDANTRVYTVWSASDYELEPVNDGPPYRMLRVAPLATRSFPAWARAVRITGTWGYNVTGSYPDAINAACLILAARYFKRKDAVFGVMGTPELGFTRITARDPEVMGLLNPYRRAWIGAV